MKHLAIHLFFFKAIVTKAFNLPNPSIRSTLHLKVKLDSVNCSRRSLINTVLLSPVIAPLPSLAEPSKRLTAYLIDSTIPPTLYPLKAKREAAVLKGLGSGSGTPKIPYTDNRLTTNNVLNKALKGVIKLSEPEEIIQSFVFLGVNYEESEDGKLAEALIEDIIKARAMKDTGIGLAFAPLSAQPFLEEYLKKGDEDSLLESVEKVGISKETMLYYIPVLRLARKKGLSLIALLPEVEDRKMVRKEGLQSLDIEKRADYVIDAEGFINLTQDPKFRLYTDKSMMIDFKPVNKKDTPGDFFAERILVDEAIATSVAKWAISRPPDALVIIIQDIKNVRYMGGANGRIPRIYKSFLPDSKVSEESVTSILINPSAKETLSQSRFLRLEIGTSPQNIQYQTKIADYLWFSTIPKVNLIPRMMNPL